MEWMILMGVVTGMRSMTALAVLCLFAWLGLLPEHGWAAWSAMAVSAIIFCIGALGEYAGDLSPLAPFRTTAFPLIVRFLVGGLAGALCATALRQPVVGGVVFGVIGVPIGAYGCVRWRVALARKLGREWPVGLGESALALGMAVLAAAMIHHGVMKEMTMTTYR